MKASSALLLAAAGLLLLAGSASASTSKVITSSGPKTTRKSTYEGDTAAWARRRYQVAHDYFAKYWGNALSEEGVHDAALSVLAHWSLETAGGSAEYNFNVGNIHAVGSQPWFQSGDTSAAAKKYQTSFAAYDTLDEGAGAYFDLLEKHYSNCLQTLVDAPTEADWFRCLGAHNYYAKTLRGKDNLEPAAAGWAARRALLAQYATN